MKKNNWWNRIFHKQQVTEELEKYRSYKGMKELFTELYNSLKECKTLEEMLSIHKRLWNVGYRNDNLGPCSYGMFRTKDIRTMTPDEVYLGNIYGLSTKNIPFWEEYKDETMAGNGFGIDESILMYDLIMNQYRRLLLSNLLSIKNQVINYIDEYESINRPKDSFKMW